MARSGWCAALLLAGWWAPSGLVAQDDLPVEIGGLLRTGFRAEPSTSAEADGFDIFDARVSLGGEIGIVFDYFTQAEFDSGTETLRLLDATLTIPVIPEVEITFGLFRPRWGYEALLPKGEITFADRSQAATAIGPGRQVGVEVGGEALDARLTWGAGVFNGNGREFENDGDDFMYAARVEYNSIGTIAFYDDFVFQIGASIGYSEDTSVELGPGIVTGDPSAAPGIATAFAGDRLFWSGDLQLSYRGWTITGEYMRADYDLDAPLAPGGPGAGLVETEAWGGYVEAGYRAFGALEGVVRYDGFRPALGDSRDFLQVGLNLYPGHYTKFGLQYAFDVDDAPGGATLRGDQFILLLQLDF